MSTTQPIRDQNDLKKLRNFYRDIEPNPRNYTLICMGLNTALRISDLLCLKWGDVFDFRNHHLRDHIFVIEEKTGKKNCIFLNKSVQEALSYFLQSLSNVNEEQFLFMGCHQKNNQQLHRTQAYRIIRHACESLDLGKNISCHSMRKTFGYQAWKSGVQPALLMNIYNHSSFNITKIYLGIDQDDRDSVFCQINL